MLVHDFCMRGEPKLLPDMKIKINKTNMGSFYQFGCKWKEPL